jgi:hypothetical protein
MSNSKIPSQKPSPVDNLNTALESEKGQETIKRGQKLVEENGELSENEPRSSFDSQGEIATATMTLTQAVDQMVPPLLLSLGILDSAIKWLKGIAVLGSCIALIAIYIAVQSFRAAAHNQRAAEAVIKSNQELKEMREELQKANNAIKEATKAGARAEVKAAAEPRLAAGDRPGEVTIVVPHVDPEDLKKAEKNAEEAVEKGLPAPPPPAPKTATKIPAQLKPGEVGKLNNILKKERK